MRERRWSFRPALCRRHFRTGSSSQSLACYRDDHKAGAKAEGGRSGDPQNGGRVFAKRRHSKYSTPDTDNHHDSADDSHGP